MEQCACKIHSQQVLYIEALASVDMASYGECPCQWCSVDESSKWREAWKHLRTFSDAVACPKVNLRAKDPEDNVGLMGRKPECRALECKECGSEGVKGIPICTRLETSQEQVQWKVFEDMITVPTSADGKVKAQKLEDQTIPKEGRLYDLWAAFKEHNKPYMAHHASLSSRQTSPRSTPPMLHQHDNARLPEDVAHGGNHPLYHADSLGGRQGARDEDVDFCI